MRSAFSVLAPVTLALAVSGCVNALHVASEPTDVRLRVEARLRAANRQRHVAGLEPVAANALWLRRYPVRPFG
jgi:hypothetical protein